MRANVSHLMEPKLWLQQQAHDIYVALLAAQIQRCLARAHAVHLQFRQARTSHARTCLQQPLLMLQNSFDGAWVVIEGCHHQRCAPAFSLARARISLQPQELSDCIRVAVAAAQRQGSVPVTQVTVDGRFTAHDQVEHGVNVIRFHRLVQCKYVGTPWVRRMNVSYPLGQLDIQLLIMYYNTGGI